MRIEGNSGAQKQDLPGITPPAAGSSKPRPAEGGAASSHVDLSPAGTSLVESAAAQEEVNSAAVAEARELLQAGELDTPEAARRAAENLIDRGI